MNPSIAITPEGSRTEAGTAADICSLLLGVPLDRVVVFDTETTGLQAGMDELLQVSIVDAFGKKLLDSYVKPTHTRSWPDAQRVNGISPKDVRKAPKIEELAPEIRALLGDDKLVVAYNIRFDLGFINAAGIFDYNWIPEHSYDVMAEYARVHGRSTWRDTGRFKYSKLADCARSYGYSYAAHDSLEDAKATAWCFRSLICDAEYLRLVTEASSSERRISATQSKATREAAEELLSGQTRSLVGDGELSLGEFARGKSRGMPRYVVRLNGREVGTCSLRANEKVRNFRLLGPDDDLPKSVACNVSLSKDGTGAVHCSADISEESPLLKRAVELADQYRPRPRELEANDAAANRSVETRAVVEAKPAGHMRTSPEMEHRVAGRGLAIFRKLVLWSIGVSLAITGAFALMYVPFGGGLASLIVAVILLWPAVRLIGKARKS